MDQKIIDQIKIGEIGVIPTDTIYGLVGSAFSHEVVKKIYLVKNRDLNKPFIILISSISDLNKFNVDLTDQARRYLEIIWPGPISVILPCSDPKLEYLHRGTQSLAFRVPKNDYLLNFLTQTGPLVAPSVNPEGKPPASDINQAKQYFGDQIKFYLNGGTMLGQPSTLIKIEENQIIILRQGKDQVPYLAPFKISSTI